jgi:glycine cleavage system H protein
MRDGAVPCIWMTAGQLSYKLCDRELDCDHCPLDAALQGRGTLPRPSDHVSEPAAWEFPEDRSYDRSHAWVRALHGQRVRCGLDVLAGRMLDRATALVPPPVPSRVTVGKPACWVLDEGEFIPLRSPVTGTVSRVNRRVSLEPGLLCASPYDDGVASDLKTIQALTNRADGHPDLGPTLEDGGEPTLAARAQLGPTEYRKLLRGLLS